MTGRKTPIYLLTKLLTGLLDTLEYFEQSWSWFHQTSLQGLTITITDLGSIHDMSLKETAEQLSQAWQWQTETDNNNNILYSSQQEIKFKGHIINIKKQIFNFFKPNQSWLHEDDDDNHFYNSFIY